MPERAVLVAGGTVQAGGGLYLEREADRRLLELCRAGDFAFVLTSRQMGKSSLVIRTVEKLQDQGFRPVFVDLTEMGSMVDADQWYRGLVIAIADQLELQMDVRQWWSAASATSLSQRFTTFLQDVVARAVDGHVIVFIDEIDTTLRLDFTDDFFTGIRFLHNARATNPSLSRISFVLSGVATPGDLIKDRERTPFNVGTRVELTDFTIKEASPLVSVLPVPPDVAQDVIRAILSHTGGHPYLTLRVAQSLMHEAPSAWSPDAIAERVATLFYDLASDRDSNLTFVRDMLTRKALQPENTLRVYQDVRRGRNVPDQELDEVRNWLKLSGIVVPRDGMLRVRNPIYERVFDLPWVRRHIGLYVNWRRRLTRIGAAVLVFLMLGSIPLAIWALTSRRAAIQEASRAAAASADAKAQAEQAMLQSTEADRARQQAAVLANLAEIRRLEAEASGALALRESAAALEARRSAVSSLSRAHFLQGESLLGQGRLSTGLAYLLAAAEADPSNAATRDLAFDTLLRAGFATPLNRVTLAAEMPPQSARTHVELSGDGGRALICDSSECGLFSAASGKRLSRFLFPDGSGSSLGRLSADGRLVVTITGAPTKVLVTVFDADSGRELRSTELPVGFDFQSSTVRVSVGKSRILLRDFVQSSLIDLTSGRVVVTSNANTPGFGTGPVSLSENDRFYAFARESPSRAGPPSTPNVELFDATTGAFVKEISLDTRNVTVVSLNADGSELAVGYRDGSIDLRPTRSDDSSPTPQEAIRTFSHGATIVGARFSPDGSRLMSVASDGTTMVWSTQTGRSYVAPIRDTTPHASVAFAPDNVVVTLSQQGTIQRWRLTPPATDLQLPSFNSFIFSQSDVAPERILVSMSETSVALWDLAAGRVVAGPFEDPGDRFGYAEISRDGRTIVAGTSLLRVWDVGSKRLVCKLDIMTGEVVRVSADGRWVAAYNDDTIQLVDVPAKCRRKEPLQLDSSIGWITFSPDAQRLIVTLDDGGIRLVDPLSQEVIARTPHVVKFPIVELGISPQRFVTVDDPSTVQVRDLMSGAPIGPAFKPEGPVSFAILDQSGERVLIGTGTQAQLWRMGSGRPIGQVLRHESSIEVAAFNQEGTRIVTLSEDHRSRVWDAASGLPVTGWIADGNDYQFVYFTKDGTRLIMLSDGVVAVRDLFQSTPSDVAVLRRLVESQAGLLLDQDSLPRGTDVFAARNAGTGRAPVPASSPAMAPLVRWLLSDPSVRTVSPRSSLSIAGYLKIVEGIENIKDRSRMFFGLPQAEKR